MKITLSVDGKLPRISALLQAGTAAAAVYYAAASHNVAMPDSIELAVIAAYGHLATFIAASHS
ncbi:hypothetical protein [Sphaerisporangium sp. TRM90804]|uniref:hypothetical protein n=1 Tax=Sphaerisporangium sp. TRM90804 TaxID=3031113 RepID=UPI00244C721B|nr:hypothetical protein [Sphaerisporangium sp. TRM90804]MDH2426448.1 hypothetical protein [Sphaerisporangium sp. TRM90804]